MSENSNSAVSSSVSDTSSIDEISQPVEMAIPRANPNPEFTYISTKYSKKDIDLKGKKLIAFGIDDGPNDLIDEFTDVFYDNNAHATFFIMAVNALKEYGKLDDARRRVTEARVVTAAPLSKEEKTRLLAKLSSHYGTIRFRNDSYNVMVSLVPEAAAALSAAGASPMTKDTWRQAFQEQLQRYKDDGFERINPSILKADITSVYPDFTEKSIGFKRFSDVLKQLEKDGFLALEQDGQRNLLIKML